jgi:hypothetical protein
MGNITALKRFFNVERTGENKAACANATSSAVVADWIAAKLRCKRGTTTDGVSGSLGAGWVWMSSDTRLRCQSQVSRLRPPDKICFSSRNTVTDVASKVTVQPASHSCPMDSNDADFSAGTMCTRRAASGKFGKARSASWVEYISVPLGLAIPMGCVVGLLFTTAAVTVQKCAVLPLSAIA